MKLESITAGRAVLSVSTRFLKSWIESHYHKRIFSALESEIGGILAVEVAVRSSGGYPHASATNPDLSRRGPEGGAKGGAGSRSTLTAAGVLRGTPARCEKKSFNDSLSGSPLDHRLSFSSFIVGRANQLAFSAAHQISDSTPGEALAYNPLYIHACVGLGKTHILQAIAHAATGQGRSVVYLTAEKFMYGFVAALNAQTAIAFKQALRSIDLLILDDVQFLQGKVIQAEFGHILNALVDACRQVVIASDRPPSDLEALDERVRSRLAGGLCVEMHPPDESLRIQILQTRIAAARVHNPWFEVAPSVLAFVARSIVSNGRDLEGAVNRLVAHSGAGGPPLTADVAAVAIRDLIRSHVPKRVKIEDIQKLVAAHYSVTRSDILSSRRTATVVKPRQVAMYLAKTLTLRSLPEIGRRFGGRDHTTVLHSVRKIEGLYTDNSAVRDEIEHLKCMLQD